MYTSKLVYLTCMALLLRRSDLLGLKSELARAKDQTEAMVKEV